MKDRLIKEEDGEFQKWYDNLDTKYDIVFDLHDNWTPEFQRKSVNSQAKKHGLGYVMKDGYVAVKDHELPYAGVIYQRYSKNIDDTLHTFETRWNKEHEWRRVEFRPAVEPLFLKPSADIEMAVEFMPVRIVYRPKRVGRTKVSTGTSLITELTEMLRYS